MNKTKKGLKLAEVVLIVEVVLVLVAGALVFALGSTSNHSALENMNTSWQYAVYAITFSAVNLGGFSLGPTTIVVAIFAYINFLILIALIVTIARTKATRHLIALLGYLIGFILAMLAASFFLMVARPLLGVISTPKKVLVFGMLVLSFLIYVLALFCALAAFTGASKDVAERKEAAKEKEKDNQYGEELKQRDEKIAELERRVSVLEAALIHGAKSTKEKVVVVEKVTEKEEPKPEPAPVVEEPVEETSKEVIERIPFTTKLKKSDKDLKDKYNELKAFLLSFGVKSRISVSGDSFRAHKETYAIISVAGKHLKVYLPLKVKSYDGSTIPVVDVSHFKKYKETPLAINVRSDLSVKRAKILIMDVMKDKNATQGEIVEKNYAAQVIKEAKAK